MGNQLKVGFLFGKAGQRARVLHARLQKAEQKRTRVIPNGNNLNKCIQVDAVAGGKTARTHLGRRIRFGTTEVTTRDIFNVPHGNAKRIVRFSFASCFALDNTEF